MPLGVEVVHQIQFEMTRAKESHNHEVQANRYHIPLALNIPNFGLSMMQILLNRYNDEGTNHRRHDSEPNHQVHPPNSTQFANGRDDLVLSDLQFFSGREGKLDPVRYNHGRNLDGINRLRVPQETDPNQSRAGSTGDAHTLDNQSRTDSVAGLDLLDTPRSNGSHSEYEAQQLRAIVEQEYRLQCQRAAERFIMLDSAANGTNKLDFSKIKSDNKSFANLQASKRSQRKSTRKDLLSSMIE